MKILVASTHVPFIKGGGTMIVDDLVAAMKERSFEVETLSIPFHSVWSEMSEQMLAIRMINLDALCQTADRLICIRTPSYLLKHSNKVAWFIHHHRGAYDLWGTEYQDIPNNEEGLHFRQTLFDSDNNALREMKAIFTNSKRVSARLKTYNNLDSKVLYPPLSNAERFHCNEYEKYIFYPSRISGHKRQALAIRSMQYAKGDIKLVIAGSPDLPWQLEELEDLVESLGLTDRVHVLGRWISDEEKIRLLANARATMYIPFDEDSYGYATLEAFSSQKAVITCTDSGGALEIIDDAETGFVCEPEPQQVAQAIDKLAGDQALAKKLGQNAWQRLTAMNISWDPVVEALTA